MNKTNLYKLQKFASGSSILYVEDNKTLQDKLGQFFNIIFDNSYQGFDGKEGLNKFNEFTPSVILTDLTLPKISGMDMIMELQELNSDTSIIVLSAHNEDLELMQSFDMGLVEILIKPIDVDKLILALIKALKKNYAQTIDSEFFNDIENFKEQQTSIKFINSYKGIPIVNNGEIIKIDSDEFQVKVPHIQTIAIKNEKHTIIEFKHRDKYIQAFVLDVDTQLDIITLYKAKYISFQTRNLEYKRLKTDDTFKIGLHYQTQNVDVKSIDISHSYISMFFENPTIQFKPNDNIDITLGFYINNASSMINEKRFMKAFAKGIITRIEPYKSGQKLISTIQISKADENIFNQYLKQREVEIIQSLKGQLQLSG